MMHIYMRTFLALALLGCDIIAENEKPQQNEDTEFEENSLFCEGDPNQNLISEDQDCDGVNTDFDCDDLDPDLKAIARDQDCDGTIFIDDCDDNDANSTIVALDGDCDGVLKIEDCDDSNPSDTHLAGDCDQDGIPSSDDCDDFNAFDAEGSGDCDQDGVLAQDDCDDSDPDIRGMNLKITHDQTESFGSIVVYIYDHNDNLIYEGPPGSGAYQSWTYDVDGNILLFSSGAGTITYFYDSDGNIISSERYHSGTNQTYLNEIYDYDASGQLVLVTGFDSIGEVLMETSYSYHPNGAMASKISDYISSGYVVETHQWTYNENEQLLNYWDGSGIGLNEEYSYDANGNVLTEERAENGFVWCHSHTYDADDNRILTEYGTDNQNCYLSSYDSTFRYSYSTNATGLSVTISKDFGNDGIVDRYVYEQYDLDGNPLEVVNDYYADQSHYLYQYWTYELFCP